MKRKGSEKRRRWVKGKGGEREGTERVREKKTVSAIQLSTNSQLITSH